MLRSGSGFVPDLHPSPTLPPYGVRRAPDAESGPDLTCPESLVFRGTAGDDWFDSLGWMPYPRTYDLNDVDGLLAGLRRYCRIDGHYVATSRPQLVSDPYAMT